MDSAYRQKILTFAAHMQGNSVMLGATAVAVFALIVSLFVYAIYSWIDAAKFGMTARDEILHIAIPIFIAVALIPFGVQQLINTLNVVIY